MRTLPASALCAVLACAYGSTVVTPSGAQLSLTPLPPDCRIEFYRTKPPERPFDEIATLHYTARARATIEGAQEAMRKKACASGADAVIVTRDLVLGSMIGVAISYRDAREKHRIDHALRRAARADYEKQLADARKEEPGVPAGFLPARVLAAAPFFAIADRRSEQRGEIAAGADVWVDPQPSSGWRRVFVRGGKRGWIEDDAIELRLPPEPSAPGEPGRRSPSSI
jgi:hypothetical protein